MYAAIISIVLAGFGYMLALMVAAYHDVHTPLGMSINFIYAFQRPDDDAGSF